ncbi:peptidase S8/S53 domain-containing protein [Mycena latifolia]|nr:peptidase S8/S53 domain-containing protein [Mycena latifolia]
MIMISRRPPSCMLLLVYLALCSTVLAAVLEAPTMEARQAKTKSKAVSKKAPAFKASVPKAPVVEPPRIKKPAKPPTASKKVSAKPGRESELLTLNILSHVSQSKAKSKPATSKKAPAKSKLPAKGSTSKKGPAKSKTPAKGSTSKKVPSKSPGSAAPSSDGLSCVKPTSTKKPRKVGDEVPDQFIVHLKPGVNRAKHIAAVKALVAQAAKCDRTKSAITLDGPDLEKLSLYGGVFGPSVIAAIRKLADVQSVVADTLVQAESVIPLTPAANLTKRAQFDTTQTNTWGLARLNTGTKTVLKQLKVVENLVNPSATDKNRNSRNWPFKNIRNAGNGVNASRPRVYVIDTGVSDHTDLTGRIIRRPGANVAVPGIRSDDTTDTTIASHGTRMAGIIAGATCGVAKSVNIIPVKAGNSERITQMGIMTGLFFAFQDAKGQGTLSKSVINISLTMSKDKSDGLSAVIDLVIRQGMHVVNSAGNQHRDECATRVGNTDGPITVGGVDIDDKISTVSNFGACVTVYAPGADIIAPAKDGTTFRSASGTSEATAYTSGLLATLLSEADFTPAAMKNKSFTAQCLPKEQVVQPGEKSDETLTSCPLAELPENSRVFDGELGTYMACTYGDLGVRNLTRHGEQGREKANTYAWGLAGVCWAAGMPADYLPICSISFVEHVFPPMKEIFAARGSHLSANADLVYMRSNIDEASGGGAYMPVWSVLGVERK